ncbi:UNVERIFIED_CONTAM: hypothetical protein FKN15_055081 [Acipenser sinensis]
MRAAGKPAPTGTCHICRTRRTGRAVSSLPLLSLAQLLGEETFSRHAAGFPWKQRRALSTEQRRYRVAAGGREPSPEWIEKPFGCRAPQHWNKLPGAPTALQRSLETSGHMEQVMQKHGAGPPPVTVFRESCYTIAVLPPPSSERISTTVKKISNSY